MFTGVLTALITPFKDNKIDESALRQLITYQRNQGIDGIVVCGSTGEFFTLSAAEQSLVTQIAVDEVKGNIPIVVGVGHFTTAYTIELAKQAQDNGASGLLIVSPPYIKPSAPALLQHYTTVHDQTNLPILLYDNPGRGSIVIPDSVVSELAQLPRIVGLKDASGNLNRPRLLAPYLPDTFGLLSGDDSTMLAFMAQGGHGVISVSSNVAPYLIKQQLQAWCDNDFETTARLRDQLSPLHDIMFCEPSPAAAKYACARMDLCQNEVRLPMHTLTLDNCLRVDEILTQLQLISG